MNYSISNIVVFFLALIGLVVTTLVNLKISYISVYSKFYIFFLYILCSSIVVSYIFRVKSFDYIPIFPLTCIYFLSCYLSLAFFKFSIFTTHSIVNVGDLDFAIQVLFLGICFFIIGYFTFKLIFKKFERREFKILNFSKVEIFYFGLALNLLTVTFFYFIKVQNILTYTAQLKYVFLFLGFGTFTNYLYHSSSFYEKKNFLIILFKILIIFVEILQGSYALPFILIFLDFIYYSYLRKKINIIPIMIFVIAFLFIHEGKYQFRNLTWDHYKYKRDQNTLETTKIFLKLYKYNLENYFSIKKTFNDNNETYRRLNHSFESLVIVTSQTPNEIDYWNGYSYKILASKLIPRVFWKEKPSDTLGNEFAHRYKIINEVDRNTSWNMPVLNEFYVNFGLKGVTLGMFFLGFFFSLISKFFSINEKKNIEGVIAFYLFIPLFYLESHLSLLIGAILQSYILCIVISILFIIFFRRLRLSLYFK